MTHPNGFQFQPTKNLNRYLREYGVVCLSDNTPAPPEGMANINWQTDSDGNISAYVEPGGGGGVVPSATTILPAYTENGLEVQGTGASLSNLNQSNQWDMSWPGTLSLGSQNPIPVLLPSTTDYNSISNYGYFSNYVGLDTNFTIEGSGFSLGNAGLWTVGHGMSSVLNTGVRGIHQNTSFIINKHSAGDTAGIYGYVFTDGGVSAQSDEGVTGLQCEQSENVGYYHGTVVSSSGVNDRSPVWSSATSGNNWTTDGAFMLNISRPIVSSRVTVPTPSSGTTFVQLDLNGTETDTYLYSFGCTASSIPISTAIGYGIIPNWDSSVTYTDREVVLYTDGNYYQSTVAGNLNQNPATSGSWQNQGTSFEQIPNQSCTADSPVSCTFTIQLVTFNDSTNGFSVGDHISVAGTSYPEQSVITAVTTTGTTQRVTCLLRNPNSQVIIFKGGVAGGYISSAANLAFSGMRSSYYAFGSLDGTNLIYGLNVGGGTTNLLPQAGSEQWTSDGTANSEFTIYPGAEIVSNPDYNNPAGHIEQNNVPWTAGDVVENPHYPVYGGTGMWIIKSQITPANPRHGSSGFLLDIGGTGWGGGNTNHIQANNYNPVTYYGGGGNANNTLVAPGALTFTGPYSTGLFFGNAPQSGTDAQYPLIKVGSPFDGVTQADVFVIQFNYNESGNFIYSPTNGWWSFSGNLLANTFVTNQTGAPLAGATGSFVSEDSKTVTVVGGIITSIV